MKILTNVKTAQVSGISQTLGAFISYLDKQKEHIKIVGVDVVAKDVKGNKSIESKEKDGRFTLIRTSADFPPINIPIKTVKTLEEVKQSYTELIETYKKAIKKEKPDVVLVNGTFFMPWCLFLACQELNQPVVLHYHGIISRETKNWPPHCQSLFKDMEKCFDTKGIHYIFPSQLTRDVVEAEVFGHPVACATVLPNPIPAHFFDMKHKRPTKKKIAFVGRLSYVKNPKFILAFAKYNKRRANGFEIHVLSDADKYNGSVDQLKGLVTLHRPVDQEKLGEFYRKMDIILSPSHFETYGNVPVEAMASGTPALVNPNMGVAEVYRDLGLEDWIIDFDSPKEVFEKIKALETKRVSPEIREILKAKLEPGQVHKQMVQILKSVA